MDVSSLEPPAKRPRVGSSSTFSPVTPAPPAPPVDVINLVDDSDMDDDDDDEIIITPIKSGRRHSDDPVIVPSAPAPTGTVIKPTPGGAAGDDEVQATVIWKSAIIYAHARSDCMAHRFDRKPSDTAHDLNLLFCDKCYCCT
jgi:hypothetical protein